MNSRKRKQERSKTTRLKEHKLGVAFLLGLVLAPLSIGILLINSSIGSSWEIATGTVEIRVNGNPVPVGVDVTDDNNPLIHKGGYVQTQKSAFKLKDATNWTYDPLLAGSTAIQVIVDYPIHVTLNPLDGTLYQVDDSIDYRRYTKQVGDITYTFYHHIWLVGIEIRSDGVAETITDGVTTSYAGTCEGLPSLGDQQHHYADVRVFVGFNVQPWDVNVGDTNGTHRITTAWHGVMSASVYDLVGFGAVPGGPSSPTYGGTADVRNTVGSAVNMYDSLGWGLTNYQDTADGEDSALGSISGIPSFVVFEVGAKLEPGLFITPGMWPGTWADAQPVDNYVTYLVRVDELRLEGSTLISGDQVTITNPTDFEPEPTLPSWGLGSNTLLIVMVIVGSLSLVVIIWKLK